MKKRNEIQSLWDGNISPEVRKQSELFKEALNGSSSKQRNEDRSELKSRPNRDEAGELECTQDKPQVGGS
ncbi:hypothetical protein LCGC14_1538790 [marine sediment metagenome]|uniref:Uncharacterized protein n=1 Tax=marine sediment metagenome TaxID=412755 RepID=A0A0F9ITR9_9ZZZZ